MKRAAFHLAVVLLTSGAGVKTLDAQRPWYDCGHVSRATEHEIATKFAPTLRFFEEEQYRPTFAFADAMDGSNNNDVAADDFYDPDEVAPLVGASGQHANWDALDGRPRVKASSQQYVFYRIRCAGRGETDIMERFLRKDAQAWKRTRLETVWSQLKNRSLVVVEYYFYYVNDTGIQGHAHDIEFLYVFLPNDSTLKDRLQIIVSAGHSPRTPNGVLVLHDAVLDQRVFATVEFGGHATVPLRDDKPGPFRYAIDTNWHVPHTWGPRDVMAVSGEGFSGDYSSQHSFERRQDHQLAWNVTDSIHSYRLAPAEVFAELFEHIRDSDERSILATLATIDSLWGGNAFVVPDSLSKEVMNRLELWPRRFEVDGIPYKNESKHQPWLHRHYKLPPSLILKDHLYRPASWNWFDNLAWGGSGVFAESIGPYVGVVLPFPYTYLYIPGVLELGVGMMATDEHADMDSFLQRSTWTPMLALTYDNSYRDLLTFFMRATWTDDPREKLGIDAREFSLSLGPSILLWSSDRRNTFLPTRVANALRIRIGPRFYPRELDDLVHRTALELSVSFRQ